MNSPIDPDCPDPDRNDKEYELWMRNRDGSRSENPDRAIDPTRSVARGAPLKLEPDGDTTWSFARTAATLKHNTAIATNALRFITTLQNGRNKASGGQP